MLKIYLKDLFKVASRGDAREESYYSTLEKLLYDYSDIKRFNNIYITTLPKKTEAGNPDFRIGSKNILQNCYFSGKDNRDSK